MQPHPFDGVDLRQNPEQYKIGRGEYGVFHAQPYKDELLPLWAFRTPEVARESADRIHQKYLEYRAAEDFPGMDVARKYLQMGYTRARRYAKYPGGRKYDEAGEVREVEWDEEKGESAEIFKQKWDAVRDDPLYQQLKSAFQNRA